MGYPSEQLDSLRTTLPDYLERVHGITNLKSPFRCLHPEHEDINPSMSYNPKADRVKCFSCEVSGDIFDVVGWDTGVTDFCDRVEKAASLAGADIRKTQTVGSFQRPFQRQRKQRSKPKPLTGDNVGTAVTSAFFELYEPCGKRALKHLYGRGFTDKDICTYGWGWVQHPKDVMPSGFEYAPRCENGYICLPFFDSKARDSVRYCTFRMCQNGAHPKELKPRGLVSPVYEEHLLSSGEKAVYITEGVYDAVAIVALTGCPACAMVGSNTSRVLDVVDNTPPKARPKYILAMDNDEAGSKFTETLSQGLREIGTNYAIAPPYTDDAKDACDLLRITRRGVSA